MHCGRDLVSNPGLVRDQGDCLVVGDHAPGNVVEDLECPNDMCHDPESGLLGGRRGVGRCVLALQLDNRRR